MNKNDILAICMKELGDYFSDDSLCGDVIVAEVEGHGDSDKEVAVCAWHLKKRLIRLFSSFSLRVPDMEGWMGEGWIRVGDMILVRAIVDGHDYKIQMCTQVDGFVFEERTKGFV